MSKKLLEQERSIPVSKDLMYQARKQFPGYDDQAAMTLYMLDQFGKQSEVDNEQTNLINAQKTEYNKLKNALSTIGQELDSLEKEATENDTEIERLKQLVGRLKPAGELAQQEIIVSRQEAEKIEKELEKLKTIPGMDTDKYNDLNNKIQDIMNMPGVTNKEMEELERTIKDLQNKNQITNSMYGQVKKELEEKEQRFRKYIQKKGEQIKQVTKSSTEEIANYKEKIDKEFEEIKKEHEYITNLRTKMQTNADEIANLADYTKQLVKEPMTTTRPMPQLPIDSDEESQIQTKAQLARARMQKPKLEIPGLLDENIVYEDIGPVGNYRNEIYREWLNEVLPLLVKEFKKRFKDELAERNNIYPDKQIAFVIEDHAPWIWQITSDDTPEVSRRQLDTFMNVVKVDLFRKNPELSFSEGLSVVYERMLDNIILETLKKY